MDWNTEFNIDIKEVAKEVRQIGEEKKVIYDDYGKAVPKRSYYQELRDRPCGQLPTKCRRHGKVINMKDKIILDLCGGTGSFPHTT